MTGWNEHTVGSFVGDLATQSATPPAFDAGHPDRNLLFDDWGDPLLICG